MQYAEIISKEYLSQIFYFCLGKTGNVQYAEELTSDIYYEILLSLNRGNVPVNLSAWVWKIARNCYSKWVAKKKCAEVHPIINEENVFTGIPDDTDIEDDAISTAEINILHRELALIGKEYREIIVSHYFEGNSVYRIADDLKVPVGTVKTRLQNGRRKLKEGMEMTREFGLRSYKADEVHFVLTGEMSNADKLSELLGRKIPKNILMETYRNPSTIENLSLELGIASVYMEEEVQLLHKANLLNCENGRFQTNFCIISRQAQEDIYNKIYQNMEETVKIMIAYIANLIKNPKRFEEIKHSLLLTLTDLMWVEALQKIGVFTEDSISLENNWMLAGYEEYNGKKQKLIILNEGGYVMNEQAVVPKVPDIFEKNCMDNAATEWKNAIEDSFINLAHDIKTRIENDMPKHLVNNPSQMENVMNGFVPRGAMLEMAEKIKFA